VVELLLLQMETKLEERNVESIRRDEKNAPRVVIAVVVAVVVVVVVVVIFVSAFMSRASFVRCAIARLMLSMYLCGENEVLSFVLFFSLERREREKKKKKSNDMRYNFFLRRARARGGALKLSLCLSLSPDLLVMMM